MPRDPQNTCLVHLGEQCGCARSSADQFAGIGGNFNLYNSQPFYPTSTGYYPPGPTSGSVYPYQSAPRRSAGSAAQRNGPSQHDLGVLNNVPGFNNPVQTSYRYPTSSDLNAFLSDSPPYPASTPFRPQTEPRRPSGTSNGRGVSISSDARNVPQYPNQNNAAVHQTSTGLNMPNANANASSGNQYNSNERCAPAYNVASDHGQARPNRRRPRREPRSPSGSYDDSDENTSHRAQAPRR